MGLRTSAMWRRIILCWQSGAKLRQQLPEPIDPYFVLMSRAAALADDYLTVLLASAIL
jgi:hypothetical protein